MPAAATGVGLALAAVPAPAEAQNPGPESHHEVAVYVGGTFGGGRVHYGLEYAHRIANGWEDQRDAGLSDVRPDALLTVRAGMVDRRPRASVTFGGGLGVHPGFAATASLGIGFDAANEQPWMLPLLFDARFVFAGAYASVDLTSVRRGDYGGTTIIAATHMWDEFAGPRAVAGRALRGDDGRDLRTREAWAGRWSERAADEAASIPAFDALAIDLLHLGAPVSLVRRAADAANDEVRHASLASRLAGHPPSFVVPPASARHPQPGDSGLRRLVLESLRDGILGEGVAARVALHEAGRLNSSRARAAQQTIGRDETRHAALASDVVSWASAVAPQLTRDALREGLARHRALLDLPSEEGTPDRSDLFVEAEEEHVIARSVFEETAHRLRHLVG